MDVWGDLPDFDQALPRLMEIYGWSDAAAVMPTGESLSADSRSLRVVADESLCGRSYTVELSGFSAMAH